MDQPWKHKPANKEDSMATDDRCCTIGMGSVRTGRRRKQILESIHTKRLGAAEDIANAALFLAEGSSGWISGQILSVDGGRS